MESKNSIASSKNNMLAVVEETAGHVSFYDTHSGACLGTLCVGFLPHEISVTEDGRTAYVPNFGIRDYDSKIGEPGASISVIDIASRVEKYRLFTFNADDKLLINQIDRAPHGGVLRPPTKNLLYVNMEVGNKILIYDLNTNQCVQKFSVNQYTHNLYFSPDGNSLWLMAVEDGVFRINPDNGDITGHVKTSTPVRGLKYSECYQFLIASTHNQILFIDPITLKILNQFDYLNIGPLFYSDITEDGHYLIVPSTMNNKVSVIDVKSKSIIKEIVPGLNPLVVCIDDQQNSVYISNATDYHITKINLINFDVQKIPCHAGPNSLMLIPFLNAKAKKTLTLAVALPLTGKDGQIGNDIMRGYEFWRILVNRAGGLFVNEHAYHIEIIYADDHSNPETTVQLTKQFINQFSVDLLLSPFYSTAHQKLKSLLETSHCLLTPALAMQGDWQPNQIAQGYDYFITQEIYSNCFYEEFNFDATHYSAAATAIGILLQQALIKTNDFDQAKLTKCFNEERFHIFYPEGVII